VKAVSRSYRVQYSTQHDDDNPVLPVKIGQYEAGALGLGTAHFAFRPDLTAEQSITVIHAAVDQGLRLIDTALAYTRRDEPAYAENLVRRALHRAGHKDDVLVATKGGHYRLDDSFPIDARPESLRAHCDSSLAALGVERIGLYQLHWPDPSVPLTDSVEALRDLQHEGKIDMIGLSNIDEQQLQQARTITPIATVQNKLSIDHSQDLPLAKLCRALHITYLAYMPLGGSRRTSSEEENACRTVASRHRVSWQQVALAWLLLQPNVVPLVGSSRIESMADSLRAPYLQLTQQDLDLLPAR
jgi:aryl-alcohol dehydrogenase-like predicted oxidoreductase